MLQFVNDAQGIRAPARLGISVSDLGLDQDASARVLNGLKFSEGLAVFALQVVSQRQVTLRGEKVRVEFERPPGLSGRALGVAREVADPTRLRDDDGREWIEIARLVRFCERLIGSTDRGQQAGVPLPGRSVIRI